jgi:type IV pilus assembly protein PilC
MPTFAYEAMDAQGREVRAEIAALNEAEAADKIRALNCFPIKLFEKNAPVAAQPQAVKRRRGFSLHFRVKQKEITTFTRQFATLLDAGLPIVRALDILERQIRPGIFKDTVAHVREDVESGSSLSEALGRHPTVIDKLYVNMVKAGEAGGVLDQILLRLADYREKSQRLKQKIIGALVYPAAVVTIATLILTFIMVFIIPQFEKMFNEMGVPLPMMTQILLAVARAIGQFWYLLAAVPLLFYIAFRLIVRLPAGRLLVDRAKLHIPVFGIIISKEAVSRFCRTLGTLEQAGVPLLDSLSIIKNATGNVVVAKAVEDVHSAVKTGDSIADPLKDSGVFDELVVNMVQVGEETGELDKMLIKIADNYDDEVDTLVGAMMSLLEPILIVGMGLAVGFIVISLFLPLITITQGLCR